MIKSLMDPDVNLDAMFFPATNGEKVYTKSELQDNERAAPKY